MIAAFAVEGDFDPSKLNSNHFEVEWPPKSGKRQSFPEVDRAEWFAPDQARKKILPGQAPFIDRLLEGSTDALWLRQRRLCICAALWHHGPHTGNRNPLSLALRHPPIVHFCTKCEVMPLMRR